METRWQSEWVGRDGTTNDDVGFPQVTEGVHRIRPNFIVTTTNRGRVNQGEMVRTIVFGHPERIGGEGGGNGSFSFFENQPLGWGESDVRQ